MIQNMTPRLNLIPLFYQVIAPSGNETEVARVIAMDRSYHLDCYKCEDCGLKLNSKIEGQGCYPLESHLFW